RGRQASSVGRNRDIEYGAGVRCKCLDLEAATQVPKPNRLIAAGGDELVHICAEGYRRDAGGMPAESLHLAARGHVPEPYRLVLAAGDQAFAVGGGGKGLDRAGVAAVGPPFLA